MTEEMTDDRIAAMASLCGDTKTTWPGNRTWLCLATEHEKNPDLHYWVAVHG